MGFTSRRRHIYDLLVSSLVDIAHFEDSLRIVWPVERHWPIDRIDSNAGVWRVDTNGVVTFGWKDTKDILAAEGDEFMKWVKKNFDWTLKTHKKDIADDFLELLEKRGKKEWPKLPKGRGRKQAKATLHD